jgi:glycerol uptake facilitator-like aquaporin
MLPVYWLAQFLGAMLAVLVLNAGAGGKMNLDFSHFGTFSWGVMFAELIGTAVFLFGLTAILERSDVKPSAKAAGIGLSLFVGILVASSLFSSIAANVDQTKIGSEVDKASGKQILTNVPHELRVDGATLNPAVALAATEKTDSQLQGADTVAEGEVEYSRLSWEVILGTFIGAALGSNLALLLGRFKQD